MSEAQTDQRSTTAAVAHTLTQAKDAGIGALSGAATLGAYGKAKAKLSGKKN
jgi:hypothetical protein